MNRFEPLIRSGTSAPIIEALLAKMPHHVLICDSQGDILQHSQSVLAAFQHGENIKAFLEENTFNKIAQTLENNQFTNKEDNTLPFLILIDNTNWVRLIFSPIIENNSLQYLLIEIQHEEEDESAVQKNMDTIWIEKMRAGISSIRAAIEMIHNYPDMDEIIVQQFRQIILDQTLQLTQYLETANQNEQDQQPLVFHYLPCRQWAKFIEQHSVHLSAKNRDTFPISLPDQWLYMDTMLIVQALDFLAQKIETAQHLNHISWQISASDDDLIITLSWNGTGLRADRLAKWLDMIFTSEDVNTALKLKEILSLHHTELSHTAQDANLTLKIPFFL
jgi:hypothetical protein